MFYDHYTGNMKIIKIRIRKDHQIILIKDDLREFEYIRIIKYRS